MSIAPVKKTFRAIHKNDVEWIIELWLRIHGGDPAPEQISAAAINIIRGLAAHIDPVKQKVVLGAVGH